ncbi:Gfo/Idh/MocA family protein [Vibrio sp.]|uniref:Gfo/Idh/MocA family protein n=1 Tax=Vibrio sp. TaxID=678 RepID=UPI003D0CAAA4
MKIAIIGLGDIAQKAYLPIITQLEGIQPVFCTRDATTLQRLATRYRVVEFCPDYRDLPGMGIDAVMIHAATSVHAELAQYFLAHGIATFVDKPLADNAAEVENLYEMAERYRQPLYVGFNRRHVPLFNQHIPEMAQGQTGAITSLRWEKHRFDLPGEVRTFIFDDFIHPLDSVNLNAQSRLQDVFVHWRKDGQKLAALEVQWQHQGTLLSAVMNRQFGTTLERVNVSYQNRAYQFDSFSQGCCWSERNQSEIALPDWTPMLSSKGFEAMILDWIRVVRQGYIEPATVERNIASHQLAEALCERILTDL